MSGKKILYFDKAPGTLRDVIERNKPAGFELWYWDEIDPSERPARLAEADYFLNLATRLDARMLEQARKARFVQKGAVGFNDIDVDAAARLGLPVANLPGSNSAAVAELTLLLILALYRKLPGVNRLTKEGRWPNWEFRTSSFEMEGKVHGLIGFGNIAKETAKRSRAFGTTILYWNRSRAPVETEEAFGARYVSLDEWLRRSDIVSIHVPLVPETKGLIGIEQLRLMKREAILINVARGGIVKEQDLYLALREGIIAGAGIDTWETEPTSPDNPLLALDNVIATPHIAAGTMDMFERVIRKSFQNIVKAEEDGRPLYVVNGVETVRFA